jgi:hypothetical protein
MATTRDKVKNICDETFEQLTEVKEKIEALRDSLARNYPGEAGILGVYERHLGELVDQVDWKLQIMSHSCSYDWEGSEEFAETVSVGPTEEDFSPGYIGG